MRRAAAALLAFASLGACGDDGGSPDAGPDARIVLEGGPADAGAEDGGGAAADGGVPDDGWLDRTRVHAHTRLWRVLADTDEFAFAAAGMAELGTPVFSRHVKTGEEDPWWPSAEPTLDGAPVLAGAPDLVTPMVESADAAGLRIVAYYWHAADATVASLHPEWVCRDLAGEPVDSGRGAHLDVTSGYGDVVRTRLVELAERGFDGAYLDLHHLPPGGCFGTPLEDVFRSATGLEPPAGAGDPSYVPFLVFSSTRVAETLAGWREAARAARASFALVASASDLPGLTLPHARTAPLRHVDSPKTELHLALDPEVTAGVLEDGALALPAADVRIALGFATLRDAAGGPPHVWAPGLPDATHARGFVAAVTAWGGVANLDVAESLVLADDPSAPSYKTTRPVLREAIALGVRVSDVLGGARPTRFAAVHLPESARDARADASAAWREVLWPTVGAFEGLLRARVPVGVVDDARLADGALAGYGLLVLPAPADLDAAQSEAVGAFRAAGGAVVEMSPAWGFADPATTDAARAAYASAVAGALDNAQVRVEGGPATLHAVAFERPDGARVVALVNGIDWVQTHGTAWALDPSEVRPAPEPATGVRVIVRAGERPAAHEALADVELPVTETADGFSVEVPDVAVMALVVLRAP